MRAAAVWQSIGGVKPSEKPSEKPRFDMQSSHFPTRGHTLSIIHFLLCLLNANRAGAIIKYKNDKKLVHKPINISARI